MAPVLLVGAGFLSAVGVAAGPGWHQATPGFGSPASPVQDELDFDFYREWVEPIFLDDRGDVWGVGAACVTCHTWQTGTPFTLESLQEDAQGNVYWTEEQSRRNFLAVSALVTPGFPEQSRLLRKPLATAAGGAGTHTGGTYWSSQDDPEWQRLAEWVLTGTERPAGAPPAPSVSLDFEFFRTCVQPIFLSPREGSVACASCHASGVRGFARAIPDGRSFWNEEESRQNFEVVLRLVEPGNPLGSRLLVHPLHPDAGGSYMHNGGRRWMSQDDPEWRMLASWVNGERTGGGC